MTILDKIIFEKKIEIENKKRSLSIETFNKSPMFKCEKKSLSKSLRKNKFGIIGEYKRKSPSNPNINLKSDVEKIAKGYEKAGCAGISVLTNEKFFGGSVNDLSIVRSSCNLPILRKEFIVDIFQIYESKAIGSDAILLIASCLKKDELKSFSKIANDLDLEVLLEIHTAEELDKIPAKNVSIIGVNNRNLNDFSVSIENSIKISNYIPKNICKISESGISNISSIKKLQNIGYNGFLIGEHFMKSLNPELTAHKFIKRLKNEN